MSTVQLVLIGVLHYNNNKKIKQTFRGSLESVDGYSSFLASSVEVSFGLPPGELRRGAGDVLRGGRPSVAPESGRGIGGVQHARRRRTEREHHRTALVPLLRFHPGLALLVPLQDRLQAVPLGVVDGLLALLDLQPPDVLLYAEFFQTLAAFLFFLFLEPLGGQCLCLDFLQFLLAFFILFLL